LKTNDKGGDVQVIPIANPDQLTLFLKKELDGAWSPEPWASRLIREANGRLFLDERTLWPNGQFITAHLIVQQQVSEGASGSGQEVVGGACGAHRLDQWS
jgi:NitT/TauT family transport system substrate-binding protein